MAKITWRGQSCFEISVSNSKDHEANIVIDPYGDDIGLRVPNLSADIVLVTHDHHDHNNIKAVKPASSSQGGGGPFAIEGPGEYEVKGVFIQGISSTHGEDGGKKLGQNTIYTIEAEDMKICHLGDVNQKELTAEQLDQIGSIDILMIPVGGTYTISSVEAMKIVSQIEPKVVIPMHYEIPKLSMKLDPVDKFLKAMGKNAGSTVPQEKFVAKESTMPKEGTEVVVLLP